MLEPNNVYCGDCLDLLKEMSDNSVDAIVTDPPYGLSFMGKKWDYDVPSQAIWEECLRVLKPGGYLLAFAGTRTQHRMAVRIEDAGFEIRDMIAWVYGCLSDDTNIITPDGERAYTTIKTGDLVLCYDKYNKEYSYQSVEDVYEYNVKDTAYRIQSYFTDQIVSRNHRCLVERGGRELFVFAEELETQENIPFLEDLPSLQTTLSNTYKRTSQSQCVGQPNRKSNVIYKQPRSQTIREWGGHKTTLATITPFEYEGKMWCVKVPTGSFVAVRNGKVFTTGNSGFPKSMDIGKAIDKMLGTEYPKNTLISDTPSMTGGNYTRHTRALKQEQAKEWEGWGTALKPALEPITVARKPLELNVAQNVLKYGTGGINIDECRIPLAEGEDSEKLNSRSGYTRGFREEYVGGSKDSPGLEEQYDSSKGRFPANLIHDGSEEIVSLFPESGGRVFSTGAVRSPRLGEEVSFKMNQNHVGIDNFGDGGSASAARFFYCPKASKSEKGIETKHPTVKPIKLMEYLIKLVSKENYLILDPFGGSGTTALACKNVNRNFILIEREPDYVELAKERIRQSTPDESGLTFE